MRKQMAATLPVLHSLREGGQRWAALVYKAQLLACAHLAPGMGRPAAADELGQGLPGPRTCLQFLRAETTRF